VSGYEVTGGWGLSTYRVRSQDPPTHNDSQDIQSLVMEDIAARRREGIRKYGTPLQAWNDRDAIVDAYEEALDLVCYLRQLIEERDGD